MGTRAQLDLDRDTHDHRDDQRYGRIKGKLTINKCCDGQEDGHVDGVMKSPSYACISTVVIFWLTPTTPSVR